MYAQNSKLNLLPIDWELRMADSGAHTKTTKYQS